MTAPRRVSSCHVPWPAEITKEDPPRRAIAAWKEASVRRLGLKNSRPRILPANACGSGCFCSRSASVSSSTTCSRERSARSKKLFILKIDESRSQPVDVFLFENEGGQQPQDRRVPRGAGQDVFREQRLLHVLRGFVQAQSVQETDSLEIDHGPDLAG